MSSFMDAYNYMQKVGMHKGSARNDETGSVCAIRACVEVEARATSILDKIAIEQYPDRVKANSVNLRPIAQLNDHPDTTLDDIRMVFEKADIHSQEL